MTESEKIIINETIRKLTSDENPIVYTDDDGYLHYCRSFSQIIAVLNDMVKKLEEK